MTSDLQRKLVVKFGIDLNWLIMGESAPSAVKEASGDYYVRPDVQKLAEELSKHPKLAAAVQKLLSVDHDVERAAREVAKALGITEQEAYARLIRMKEAT